MHPYRRRVLRWMKKCGRLEVVVAALAVASVSLVIGVAWRLEYVVEQWYPASGSHSQDQLLWVNMTLVEDAVREGAVCLDGSPPAYHLHRGSGSGSRNWLIFLEGGGWCSDHASCGQRSRTRYGSSAYMQKKKPFSGILSNSAKQNPDFYNWNLVNIRYCDGASYAGYVETPVIQETQVITYRGQKIWRAIIAELLRKGMKNVDKALLAGCSAGGVGAILHCEDFQKLLPQGAYVKCLSDAGFFPDAEDISGKLTLRSLYKNVVDLQDVQQNLPEACTSSHGALCFFPQYILPYVQVPVFLLNPAYDVWQIEHVLAPDSADPDSKWHACKMQISNCLKSQLRILQDFREKLLAALRFAHDKDGWGLFINSCFFHCQTELDKSWNSVKVDNKTIREAVGEWYFNRSPVKSIDCAYPCNPSCLPWTGVNKENALSLWLRSYSQS